MLGTRFTMPTAYRPLSIRDNRHVWQFLLAYPHGTTTRSELWRFAMHFRNWRPKRIELRTILNINESSRHWFINYPAPFENDKQPSNPAAAWALWKNVRGHEAYRKDGNLYAIQFEVTLFIPGGAWTVFILTYSNYFEEKFLEVQIES